MSPTDPSAASPNPDSGPPHSAGGRFLSVPPDSLRPGPNAPEHVEAPPALVQTVQHFGVLQPLLVRQTDDGLEVIAGFKRLAAAREARLDTVPVRICRVTDEEIPALYAASNPQGERRRIPAHSSPEKHAYTPGAMIGGLLDEELNRPAKSTPYGPALVSAVLIFLMLFVAFQFHRCVRRSPAVTEEEMLATDPDGGETVSGAVDGDRETRRPGTPATRRTLQDWRRALGDISGIEVRDASGTPRVVFEAPVFSRLYTLDPDQTQRLTQVATKIREVSPESLIVVIGHTDNVPVRPGGAFESNHHLGMMRAREVEQFLITRAGIPSTRVRSTSSGSESPPFPNTPAASRAKNRTVTIEIRSPSS